MKPCNLLWFIVVFFSPSIVLAEVVTFEKEYTYQASDIDSKGSSRTIALETVRRLLLEQLGTYLVSETEIRNMQITKDRMTTYSAGIVSVEVIDEKWDGKSYRLKAKAFADPEEVAEAVKKLIEDNYKQQELVEMLKKTEELTKENDRLRSELEAGAKSKKRDKKSEANK